MAKHYLVETEKTQTLTNKTTIDLVEQGTTNAENIVVSGDLTGDGDTTLETLLVNTTCDVPTPTSDTNATNKKYVVDLVKDLESKSFTFIGFVSDTEPTKDVRVGNLWHEGTEMPTTFPFSVKKYNGTSWETTSDYTPSALEMWANLNDNQGYYYFGEKWNLIDAEVKIDNLTIGKNLLGQLEIKDEGISQAKVDSDFFKDNTLTGTTTIAEATISEATITGNTTTNDLSVESTSDTSITTNGGISATTKITAPYINATTLLTANAGYIDTSIKATNFLKGGTADINNCLNIRELIDLFLPIGTILQSTQSDFNPNDKYPETTWVKIENAFLYGSGTKTIGATGGEETHTLSVNEMPSHTHIQNAHNHGIKDEFGTADNLTINPSAHKYAQLGAYAGDGFWCEGATATNQYTGGSQAHNNMPPYLVVNIWKRTA